MPLLEVEFKGRRKCVYKNEQEFPLQPNDLVVVQADRGEDLGRVTLIGERWQERLKPEQSEEEPAPEQQIEDVLRRAGEEDLQILEENRKLEKDARTVFIEFVRKHELEMKLVDAEYQLDRKKLTFYFTADGRVDFRALVKDLAHHFRTRIDLRQIGARDESKRLGGIGICGRELCCSSWIREFQPVTTQMVKEQFLLLNPQKNTGLCGRLRCCLRYEVEQYRDVNTRFPKPDTRVKGPRGQGTIEKLNVCFDSAGIVWEDGTRHSYTYEQIVEYSDWNPEAEKKPSLLTFKEDPSKAEEQAKLVAVEEPESLYSALTSSDDSESREKKGKKGGEKKDRRSGRGGKGRARPSKSSKGESGAKAGSPEQESSDKGGESKGSGKSRRRGRRGRGKPSSKGGAPQEKKGGGKAEGKGDGDTSGGRRPGKPRRGRGGSGRNKGGGGKGGPDAQGPKNSGSKKGGGSDKGGSSPASGGGSDLPKGRPPGVRGVRNRRR
ncbi:hypothetical protein GF324_01080 [bacterium]|nr:hypothetical protein [bacterium]